MRSVTAAKAAIGTVQSRTSRLSACHTASKPCASAYRHELHRLADRVGVLQVEGHRLASWLPLLRSHSRENSRAAASAALARISSRSTLVARPPSSSDLAVAVDHRRGPGSRA